MILPYNTHNQAGIFLEQEGLTFTAHPTEEMLFGTFTTFDTSTGGVKRFTDASQKTAGFMMRDREFRNVKTVEGVDLCLVGNALKLATAGNGALARCSVDNFTPGDDIYIDCNTAGKIGFITNVATNNIKVPGSFVRLASAGIAVINFQIFNQ